MKKRIIIAVIMCSAIAVFAVSNKPIDKNDLFYANLQALSRNENPPATCTFSKVSKDQDKNKLDCSGDGTLCCTMD